MRLVVGNSRSGNRRSRLGEAKKHVGTAVSDMVGVVRAPPDNAPVPLARTRGTTDAARRRIFQFTRKVHRSTTNSPYTLTCQVLLGRLSGLYRWTPTLVLSCQAKDNSPSIILLFLVFFNLNILFIFSLYKEIYK